MRLPTFWFLVSAYFFGISTGAFLVFALAWVMTH